MMTTRELRKPYHEVFRSPFEKATREEALETFHAIQEAHPASYGWVENDAFVEPLSNGKFRAVRDHTKYYI